MEVPTSEFFEFAVRYPIIPVLRIMRDGMVVT
jgi:hypothetical protein